MKKSYFILAGILLFIVTRLYRIGEIPPSVYWDEASIGYNAYSVLQTGHDEWGDFWPLHFRAFSEFKLPVYIYAVVVSEWVFGLNALAIRFPAVIFSLFSIVITYLIAKKISGKEDIGILSAFFLSISPWLFIFSRTGYEATAGLMFYLFGLYLYLQSKTNKILLLLVTVSFILSIYSYNGYRILVPITAAFLAFDLLRQYGKTLPRLLPVMIVSLFLFLVSVLPIWRLLNESNGANRYQAIALYSSGGNQLDLIIAFIKNYLSHFSPLFLFISGDHNLRSHVPGMGELYWFELSLIILGLVVVFKRKKVEYFLLVFVLLISPLVAALTKESPHALRVLTAAPFWSLLSGLGLGLLVEKAKFKKLLTAGIVLTFLILFSFYFRGFLTNYNTQSSSSWQYAYSRIFIDYDQEFSKFDKVIVSDHEAQPYIFGLYYLRYDPDRFISEVKYNPPDKWGVSTVESFGNFIFRPIKWEELPKGNLLVFASPLEKTDNILEKTIIRNLDNTVAFYVYEYQR